MPPSIISGLGFMPPSIISAARQHRQEKLHSTGGPGRKGSRSQNRKPPPVSSFVYPPRLHPPFSARDVAGVLQV